MDTLYVFISASYFRFVLFVLSCKENDHVVGVSHRETLFLLFSFEDTKQKEKCNNNNNNNSGKNTRNSPR